MNIVSFFVSSEMNFIDISTMSIPVMKNIIIIMKLKVFVSSNLRKKFIKIPMNTRSEPIMPIIFAVVISVMCKSMRYLFNNIAMIKKQVGKVCFFYIVM